eukprot:TRINITY_DN3379_c0_g1_i2.p1 TRINITY_DN3379_c0_g1~~TRINITY_DN3379_c0_g1_i2.p1  ORF type:complete len:767 (-),score=301.80 TRINITY_DN3379_c0_g1_i2:674-2647(-)
MEKLGADTQKRLDTVGEENEWLKEKCRDLKTELEQIQSENYELVGEYETLENRLKDTQLKLNKEREAMRILKEKCEVQDSALEEAEKLATENKKIITRLKGERTSRQLTEEALANLEEKDKEGSAENSKQHAEAFKLKEKMKEMKAENAELRILLKDKEEMAETIQFLFKENSRYRNQKAEMETLLCQALTTADKLRKHVVLDSKPALEGESLGNIIDSQSSQGIAVEEPQKASPIVTVSSSRVSRMRTSPLRAAKSSTIHASSFGSPPNFNLKKREIRPIPLNLNGTDQVESSTQTSPRPSQNSETQTSPRSQQSETTQTDLQVEISVEEIQVETSEPESDLPDHSGTSESESSDGDVKSKRRSIGWTRALSSHKLRKSSTPPISPSSTITPPLPAFDLPSSPAVIQHPLDFLSPRSVEEQVIEEKISQNIEDFKEKARTFAKKTLVSQVKSDRAKSRSVLAEKKYLLSVLDHKLKSAESRIQDLNENLSGRKTHEDSLENLLGKLQEAQEIIKGKDEKIDRLVKKLCQSGNLKEGWLAKRGNILPFWRNRWVALSAVENRLYYAENAADHFRGMISLQNAKVRIDHDKKETSRDFAMIIEVPEAKGTVAYWLQAADQQSLESWVEAIQERIDRSLGKSSLSMDEELPKPEQTNET